MVWDQLVLILYAPPFAETLTAFWLLYESVQPTPGFHQSQFSFLSEQ